MFSGSNSSQSVNQKLVTYTATLLKSGTPNVISLRDFEAPLFSVDLENSEGHPQSMIALNELFNSHDGFVISLPEYNSSVTPVFKNTVDWISRIETPIFKKKPVLLMSTSPGKRGGITNLNHIAGLMQWWGGEVAATFSLPSFFEHFDVEKGMLKNDDKMKELQEAVSTFESKLTNNE